MVMKAAQGVSQRPVGPRRATATAAIGIGWVIGYLLIIRGQGTEQASAVVVFYATFICSMAALAFGAAVIHGRNPRLAQAFLYAASGGFFPAGVLGLASVGLPLIVAALLSLTAVGSHLLPRRIVAAAAGLSAGAFLIGVAATIRVS